MIQGIGRNMRQFFVMFVLVCVAAIISGCVAAADATPPSDPVTATVLPTVAATDMPEIQVTETESAEAVADDAPPTATLTPAPTATPVSTTAPDPTATPPSTPRTFAALDPSLPTPPVPIPTAVPPFPKPDNIINIVLVGNDGAYKQGGRTDTIIIASINTETETATLLSVPRDLYVYIPGWTIERINLALPHGGGANYPGGGPQLLKDTILFNLGIEIDYYARLGFDGFKKVIDTLGGVEIVNTCPLEDWRLIEPDMDPTVEENYERFTLDVGVHEMDSDLALWYARSRRSTNDADRTRRQQQLLSAMLSNSVDAGLITELPSLWAVYRDEIETDFDLPTLLRLASHASAIRENGLRHLSLNQALESGDLLPETNKWISLLRWDDAAPVLGQLMSPATLGRSSRAPLTVEVVAEYESDFKLAAENLTWWGFIPVYTQLDTTKPISTTITYHGENFKGAYDDLMSWIFHNQPVTLEPDATAATNYTVILGHTFNPCRNPLYYDPDRQ